MCIHAVVPLCRYKLVQSCPCTCIIAHTYAVIISCSRVLVRLCKHDCTILFICALVLAQLHTMMQLCFHALVLVCSRACTHAYIRAVIRLCKGSRIDKAQKRTCHPACMMAMPSRTLPTCSPCRTYSGPRGAEIPAHHG